MMALILRFATGVQNIQLLGLNHHPPLAYHLPVDMEPYDASWLLRKDNTCANFLHLPVASDYSILRENMCTAI